jgi:putative nucleotidyltransferase with HDIG domain
MNGSAVLAIGAKVSSLPGMPGQAAKLLQLLQDPEASAVQVETLLRLDPGLTANILKLANSAYFGFSSRIGSVRQAMLLLGSRRLVQLVIASSVGAVLKQPVQGYALSPGELWRHSIAVSVAAEGLVGELKVAGAEEIFTAALLHDVGKLVMGAFVQQDLPGIEACAARGESFHLAERAILGTDHAEVGAQILARWRFPEAIVQAVRHHHDPDAAPDTRRLLDVVHVANVLCLMMGIGVGREGLRYAPSPQATRRLGLKTAHLERVSSQTLQSINELSQVFQAGPANA